MTNNSLLKTLAALAITLLAASCQNPRARRIQENPAVFSALPLTEQAAVREGRVLTGMSTDAVYIALGTPSQTSAGSAEGKTAETWIYRGVRAVPDFNNYLYYRPDYGYYRTSPDYDYIPYDRAIITFINKRVVAAQQRR